MLVAERNTNREEQIAAMRMCGPAVPSSRPVGGANVPKRLPTKEEEKTVRYIREVTEKLRPNIFLCAQAGGAVFPDVVQR